MTAPISASKKIEPPHSDATASSAAKDLPKKSNSSPAPVLPAATKSKRERLCAAIKGTQAQVKELKNEIAISGHDAKLDEQLEATEATLKARQEQLSAAITGKDINSQAGLKDYQATHEKVSKEYKRTESLAHAGQVTCETFETGRKLVSHSLITKFGPAGAAVVAATDGAVNFTREATSVALNQKTVDQAKKDFLVSSGSDMLDMGINAATCGFAPAGSGTIASKIATKTVFGAATGAGREAINIGYQVLTGQHKLDVHNPNSIKHDLTQVGIAALGQGAGSLVGLGGAAAQNAAKTVTEKLLASGAELTAASAITTGETYLRVKNNGGDFGKEHLVESLKNVATGMVAGHINSRINNSQIEAVAKSASAVGVGTGLAGAHSATERNTEGATHSTPAKATPETVSPDNNSSTTTTEAATGTLVLPPAGHTNNLEPTSAKQHSPSNQQNRDTAFTDENTPSGLPKNSGPINNAPSDSPLVTSPKSAHNPASQPTPEHNKVKTDLYSMTNAIKRNGLADNFHEKLTTNQQIVVGGQGKTNFVVEIDAQGVELVNSKWGDKDKSIGSRSFVDHFSTDGLRDPERTSNFFEQHGRHEGNSVVVPLSTFINEKQGNCATMAICAQLALQQKGIQSGFVQGYLEVDGSPINHAWNVSFAPDGKVLILDYAQGFRSTVGEMKNDDGFFIFGTDKTGPGTYTLN